MSTHNGDSAVSRSHTSLQQQPTISTSANIKRVAFLRGHTDSVLCLTISNDGKLLASGSEDGAICIHALATQQLLCRSLLSKYNAVAAVLFAPQLPGGSSSSSSTEQYQSAFLFAAAGCELLLLKLQVHSATDTAAAGEQSEIGSSSSAAAAADIDVICRREVADDDISDLAVNHQGTYLAAADDAGDITLFDITKLQQQQQQQQQVLQPLRVIKSAHTPMAAAVTIRHNKPWQLLSAGMDNRITCWDYSRGRRCLAAWNMTEMTGISNPGGGISNPSKRIMRELPNDDSNAKGQMWNPPMVHAIATPSSSSSSSGGQQQQQQQQQQQRQQCVAVPAVVQKRLVAAARGDGVVAVFDADENAKPSSSTDSSSSGKAVTNGTRTSAAAAAAAAAASKNTAAKAVASSQKQVQKPATSNAATAVQQQEQQHQGSGTCEGKQQQQQQQQQQVVHLQPGFHVCLGTNAGGHSVPATAVVFPPLFGGYRLVISAGEDGRLLLWDWTAAFTQQQQQQQQQNACLLVDKQHNRKVNALACLPGSFAQLGSSSPAARAAAVSGGNSSGVSQVERCLLFVADTSSRICVYEVSAKC